MQLEIAVAGVQGVGHGHHRRDADAAADQDRAPRLARQGEVVARQADVDFPPYLHKLMHRQGTAARGRVLEHAQAIGAGVGRVAAQGILAHQPGLEVDIDMGARFEGGQGLPRRVAQVEDDDTFALLLALAHDDFQ